MPHTEKKSAKVIPLRSRTRAATTPMDRKRAKTLQKQDKAHLVHGFVPLSLHQERGMPIFVRGEGVYLWDTDGKRYLDGLASLWNVHVGHGRKEISRAVAAQMDQLAFAPTLIGPTSAPTVELAAKLTKIGPKGLRRVIFTSGGSESNETMIRLVRAYWKAKGKPKKTKFISLNQGYHGHLERGGQPDRHPAVQRAGRSRSAGCHPHGPALLLPLRAGQDLPRLWGRLRRRTRTDHRARRCRNNRRLRDRTDTGRGRRYRSAQGVAAQNP